MIADPEAVRAAAIADLGGAYDVLTRVEANLILLDAYHEAAAIATVRSGLLQRIGSLTHDAAVEAAMTNYADRAQREQAP